MSLILEALKKLEREKQTPPDRGFLVVAHVPWPAGGRGRSLWLGGVGALAVAGLLAFFLLRGREGRRTVPTEPLATTPATTPESSVPPTGRRGARGQPACGEPIAREHPRWPSRSPPARAASPLARGDAGDAGQARSRLPLHPKARATCASTPSPGRKAGPSRSSTTEWCARAMSSTGFT